MYTPQWLQTWHWEVQPFRGHFWLTMSQNLPVFWNGCEWCFTGKKMEHRCLCEQRIFVFTAISYYYCVKETTVLQSAFYDWKQHYRYTVHSILLYLQICIHIQQIYIHIYIFCMSIHLSLPSLNRLSDISIPTQALLPWWKHVVSWRCHGDFLLEQFFSNHTLVFSWFIPFLSLNHSAFFLSLWLLVSPAEDPGWQLLWLCEGQLMSLDSLVMRMKVFSGWPWASVTSLAFSLLSWTQICTNESTPWAEMIS